MYLEQVISQYNKPYTFKIVAFFILSLPAFQYSNQIQNLLFSLVTPNYSCLYQSIDTNFSVSPNQCWVTVNKSTFKCPSWNFSTFPIGETMMSEHNLVCDRTFFGDIIQITFYSTFLTGPFVGMLSDKYGRKKIVIFCLWLETISSISLVLAPDISGHLILRIILGISGSGVFVSYIWLLEIVDIDIRPFVGSFFWFYWAIAYMGFPLTVYFSRHWRLSQLLSIALNPLYLTILLIPESPRWSCVMDRKSELKESLKQIARINRLEIKLDNEDISVDPANNEESIINALKDMDFTLRALFALLAYFSVNLLYLSTVFNTTLISSNMYISVFLLGLMEFPSLVLTYFSLMCMKRKTVFLTFGGVGSGLFFLSSFISSKGIIQSISIIIFGCIAKMAIASNNQNMMVYVFELLPTTHRSFGLTIILITNAISNFGATYINRLSGVLRFLPMLIYLMFLWVTAIIVYFGLPETKDLPIPETLSDLKRLHPGREDKYLYYMHNKAEFRKCFGPDEKDKSFEVVDETACLIGGTKH